MVALVDPSRSFLSSRPEWTLHAALVTAVDGQVARIEQFPFIWNEGAWEAEITVFPIGVPEGGQSTKALVRVTPDTLRRWKEVEINPFIEACAQVADHWRRAKPGRKLTVTLL